METVDRKNNLLDKCIKKSSSINKINPKSLFHRSDNSKHPTVICMGTCFFFFLLCYCFAHYFPIAFHLLRWLLSFTHTFYPCRFEGGGGCTSCFFFAAAYSFFFSGRRLKIVCCFFPFIRNPVTDGC